MATGTTFEASKLYINGGTKKMYRPQLCIYGALGQWDICLAWIFKLGKQKHNNGN